MGIPNMHEKKIHSNYAKSIQRLGGSRGS